TKSVLHHFALFQLTRTFSAICGIVSRPAWHYLSIASAKIAGVCFLFSKLPVFAKPPSLLMIRREV
ncbi:MAG: hypothetical protein ABGZ53_11250, partial [Fuerstiella sp.]